MCDERYFIDYAEQSTKSLEKLVSTIVIQLSIQDQFFSRKHVLIEYTAYTHTKKVKNMSGESDYHAQWFSGSDSGIRARKSGLKWGSGPDFSELLPLLSGYHSKGALTFRSILYLTLQQLLGFRFIILSPITSISHNVISSNT